MPSFLHECEFLDYVFIISYLPARGILNMELRQGSWSRLLAWDEMRPSAKDCGTPSLLSGP
jgi:hypothetical protein